MNPGSLTGGYVFVSINIQQKKASSILWKDIFLAGVLEQVAYNVVSLASCYNKYVIAEAAETIDL